MDGVLIIDKPGGITSHDVVDQVRRMLGEKRVGHTGTLDPFATGVLVLLVGHATRLSQFLTGAEKEYDAIVRLGYATDTGDLTGQRVVTPDSEESRRDIRSITQEEIEASMAALRGNVQQVPPMYSAKKVGGRKLYELARQGKKIERPPAMVMIRKFEASAPWAESVEPVADGIRDLTVRVVCSGGTYVRVLAERLGELLGVGGHLIELRRSRAGAFGLDGAWPLDRLEERVSSRGPESIAGELISPDTAVAHLPLYNLTPHDTHRVTRGADLQPPANLSERWTDGEAVRLRDRHGVLRAIGFYDRTNDVLHPRVVIAARQ